MTQTHLKDLIRREEKHHLQCGWFDCGSKTTVAHERNLTATLEASLLLSALTRNILQDCICSGWPGQAFAAMSKK